MEGLILRKSQLLKRKKAFLRQRNALMGRKQIQVICRDQQDTLKVSDTFIIDKRCCTIVSFTFRTTQCDTYEQIRLTN